MIKKTCLLTLLLINTSFVRAQNSTFWSSIGAFLGGLLGSSQSVFKCACGENNQTKLKHLNCCGAVICESCLIARRHTALINKTSPRCHGCGKSFDYDMRDQSYNFMCVSNCRSDGQVKLNCGHWMCRSCLRSRVNNARKSAGSNWEPHVTCPSCNALLTNSVISQAN